jgi:hypothetical protein
MTDGRETMADVDHTPPHGDGARAIWERGGEFGTPAADGGTPDADDSEETPVTPRQTGRDAGDAV